MERVLLVLLVVLTFLAVEARAMPIELELVVRDDIIIYDAIREQEWLALEVTQGQSWNEVQQGIDNDIFGGGFGFARKYDVNRLYKNYGAVEVIDAFGTNCEAYNMNGACGFAVTTQGWLPSATYNMFGEDDKQGKAVGQIGDLNFKKPSLSAWLVRDIEPEFQDPGMHEEAAHVPEPSSLALLGISLLALTRVRRLQKAPC